MATRFRTILLKSPWPAGGCVGGGGQPYGTIDGSILQRRIQRAVGLYDEDKNMTLRKSHDNPETTRIYEDFLEKPLSHKSHELLHTLR